MWRNKLSNGQKTILFRVFTGQTVGKRILKPGAARTGAIVSEIRRNVSQSIKNE